MGVIGKVVQVLFGDGRNAIVETMGAFVENTEASAQREADGKAAALSQFAAEFSQPRKGLFDRFIDGLNRLPRPMLAFGTLGLFTAAMVDPIWFASRMQGIALVPEPLWWLMGAIVSFYFGARHQAKSQEFQSSVAQTAAQAAEVTARVKSIQALSSGAQAVPETEDNAALADWRNEHDG